MMWRSTAVRLAFAAFVLYNVNLRPISSADTFPTRYLPISLLTEGDLDLDEFKFLVKSEYPFPGDDSTGVPYYMQRRRGHLMSTYPVMPAILATPVYLIPVLLGLHGDPTATAAGNGFTRTEIVGTLLGKLAASLAIALSVALVYLGLLHLTSPAGALWIALGYAFGTSAWSVSSQGLWQTTMSQVLLAGALLALLRARESQAARPLLLAGALLGLAVACRPPALIVATFMSMYALQAHRRHFIRYFAPGPALIAVGLATYNLYYFGRLSGGYKGYVHYIVTLPHMAEAFYGLLFSPNRGMLVFSPIVIAGVVGLGLTVSRARDTLLRYLAAATLCTVVFYSTLEGWDGAFSYSYRFLVDLLPGLALGCALVWREIRARRWLRFGMVVAFALSVFVQLVGAFNYPCGWYKSTLNDPAAMARISSWSDLEIVQCLRRGPVEPDGVRLLRTVLGGAD